MILDVKVLGNAGVTPLKFPVTFLPVCKAILFLSWIKKIRCQAHFSSGNYRIITKKNLNILTKEYNHERNYSIFAGTQIDNCKKNGCGKGSR